MSFEIEQKFHVEDVSELERRLAELGAIETGTQRHSDSYYNHPSRDFRETREALRIRRVDGVPMITYKGPKLPGSVKARKECEWRLDPGDRDGSATEELLQILGFQSVAVVTKSRRCFELPGELHEFDVVIDEVPFLGRFAEVELVVEGPNQVEEARRRIAEISADLGLRQAEPRSYLTMLLELSSS